MITIHEADASDFSTLGLGALTPTEATVEEEAGGLYELALSQPITGDNRHALIANGRIIKVPAPVRETPLITAGSEGQTVTRQIYKVQTSGLRLRMRAKPSMDAKVLGSYKIGTEVVRLEVSGSWARVVLVNGGATGWMWNANLTFVRTETETVTGDTPGRVVQPRQTREQLFRIYSTRRSTGRMAAEAMAQHISFDLKGVIVASEYAPDGVPADEVCAQLKARGDHPHDFQIYCACKDAISADYTGRSVLECLLDPDDGVVAQCGGRLVRDNYDIFILPDEARDRGVELRYAKNLLEAELTEDAADIVTRIRPVGLTKNGNPLYITANGGYVDSPHAGDYPTVYTKEIAYSVQTGKDGIENAEQARAKLTELAEADFAAGIDLPTVELDAEFVRLELTEKYRAYANAHALHLYDSARVVDEHAGIYARLRMTGYEYDGVLDQYARTDLGEILDIEPVIYGYDIGRGTVSGAKILRGSVDASAALRNLSVSYAKIGVAAIEQLSADAIIAIRAHIQELVAQSITTDQLYANIAMIAVAQITTANIENANIDWATIQSLVAEIASIAQAEIGTASIDWAHIKDLVTDTQIFTEGVGGKLYVNRLAVTEANMVSLTTGELIVKGADGNFYAITIVDDVVTPVRKDVTGGNIANNTIPGGKLIENTITAREVNVQSLFVDSATIRTAIAGNLDVDTFFARVATINKIKTMTVASVENGTALLLNSGSAIIRTPLFLVEIPGAEEGEEKLRINADGVHAPNIASPTVARRMPGGVYTVYNNADFDTLADAFDALDGATLDGDVVLKLGRDDAGGTLRAVRGGRVIITSGNLIYRHAKRVQNAEFAISGSYGYRVNCPAGGTWSRAIIEVGRVGDLGLAGKDVTIKVGTITNSGATFVGASLYLLDADYQSNELHLQTLNFSDEEKTARVPADTDDDRMLCVMLQLSRGAAAAAGSYIIYDGLRVEIGDSVYGWATAQYKIADFEAVNCDRVTLSRLTLPAGVRLRAGRATITRCKLYGQIGVLADQAQVRMSDNAGACAKAVKAMGGMVHVTGAAPGGAYDGWLIDTSTAQISGSGSAPSEQTKTLAANATGTYSTYWWSGDRSVRQGYTVSNGRIRGGMWWDFAAIPSGATVTEMQLTIKRMAGFGQGGKVTVKVYGTSSNARSGQPALTTAGFALGEIGEGQTRTWDLPAAIRTGLANGTLKGIVLYADDTGTMSGKTYSANYARLEGTDGSAPRLAVTYEE